MKIKDLKKWIQTMNDNQEIIIALETLDDKGIDVILVYDIEEEPCYNGECLQLNITDKKDVQCTC